jgi:hypothetical protein
VRRAVLSLTLLAACGDDVPGIRAIEPPECGDLAAGAWDPRFALAGLGGADAAVYAMVALPDSEEVVVGGVFDNAAGIAVSNIAVYDGAWSPLGDGLPGAVLGLARDDAGVLWAIGTRDPLVLGRAYVARWDGATWSFVAEDVASLAAIAVVEGGVAVGGEFNSIGGVTASGVAIWDGVAWSERGLDAGANVSALARDGATLCAGGRFGDTDSGLAVRNGVACLSGVTWTALGDAWGGVPFALAKAPDGTWWGGGSAAFAGGNGIATLVDGTWQALDGGIFGATPEVRTIVFDGDAALVGGNFTAAGPERVLVGHLASHTSAGWAAIVDGGVDGAVDTTPFDFDRGIYAIARTGTNLSFGGAFAVAGDRAASNVASIDGLGTIAPWTGGADALGMAGDVLGIATTDGGAIVVGDLVAAGALTRERVALFDGGWTARPPAVPATIVALAPAAPGAIAISSTGSLLRWDGEQWIALPCECVATAAVGDADRRVFATTLGADDAGQVVEVVDDGRTTPLGVANGPIAAIVIHDGHLVIAGDFTEVDGATARDVAVLDDGWRGLGDDGPDGVVEALASSPTIGLVALGALAPGDAPRSHAARWDGERWSDLGRTFGEAAALTACADGVAVGGAFGELDGVAARNLAWYDGAWHGLDREGTVRTLAPADGALYVGGDGGGASAFSVRTPARP